MNRRDFEPNHRGKILLEEFLIHVNWKGPLALDEAVTARGPSDYGVYQFYGDHPVYGSRTLLYIGRAMPEVSKVRWTGQDNRKPSGLDEYRAP